MARDAHKTGSATWGRLQSWSIAGVFFLALSGPEMVAAQAKDLNNHAAQPEQTLVDPALAFFGEVIKSQGPDAPIFAALASRTMPIDADGAGALLRFKRFLSLEEIAELEGKGVRFLGHGDRKTVAPETLQAGANYRTFLVWDALEDLSSHPHLVQAEATWKPAPMPPTEVTSAQVGAAAARRLPGLGRLGDGLDGTGVVIGNIDSGIDVLHPAFFHADGGLYDWIDVNGNGRFDPGTDAVDLNHNGRADRNEVLRVLDATVVRSFDGLEVENADRAFDLRRDWLYADMNGDGRRNAGREAGFFEDDPAYGEAIFVVDDVNGNGVLDVGEKLMRLKTSKIRKYYEGTRVFERGVDLIDAVDSENFAGAHHGTAVAGILVGGQPPHHDRVGLAPGAELIVYGFGFYMDWEATIQSFYLEQAGVDGVDVLLHEWTNPIMRPLDGSTNLEAVMDALHANQGIIHVNPVGNLNRSQKHTLVTGAPGAALRLGFEVGPGHSTGESVLPYTAIYASLQWRGDQIPRILLEPPGAAPIALDPDVTGMQSFDGGLVRLLLERTSRGTYLATFYISSVSNEAGLRAGSWALILDELTEEQTFLGRITDAYTLWSSGVVWADPSEGVSTLSFPSTADSALGVTAFSGRRHTEGTNGPIVEGLRDYAGRGPRIDGRPAVRLAAPDDPLAPLAATPRVFDAGGDYGWYAPFGGTSGAAPHVAAALALLREQEPDVEPVRLVMRLEDHAERRDLFPAPLEGFPDPRWGWGKVDVLAALGVDGSLRLSGEPPMAVLLVEIDDDDVHFDASPSTGSAEGPLEYRFDVDYDGIWEGGWMGEERISVPRAFFGDAEILYARVQVRDARGESRGALARFSLRGDDAGDVGLPGDGDVGPTAPASGNKAGPTCLCASVNGSAGIEGPLSQHGPSGILITGFIMGLLLWRSRRRLRGMHGPEEAVPGERENSARKGCKRWI